MMNQCVLFLQARKSNHVIIIRHHHTKLIVLFSYDRLPSDRSVVAIRDAFDALKAPLVSETTAPVLKLIRRRMFQP